MKNQDSGFFFAIFISDFSSGSMEVFSCEFWETFKNNVSSLVTAFCSQALVEKKCYLNEPSGKINIFYNQIFYCKSVSV